MVRFRNAAGSNGLSNWYSPARERIAFGRGNRNIAPCTIQSLMSSFQATLHTSPSTTGTMPGQILSRLLFLLVVIATLSAESHPALDALALREYSTCLHDFILLTSHIASRSTATAGSRPRSTLAVPLRSTGSEPALNAKHVFVAMYKYKSSRVLRGVFSTIIKG